MKINVSNTAKIQTALDAFNGRATAHTADAAEVAAAAEKAEAALAGVKLRNRRGAVVNALSGQRLSNAYARKGYRVIRTAYTLQRFASGWFLVDLMTVKCYPTEKTGSSPVRVSPAAAADILAAAGVEVDTDLQDFLNSIPTDDDNWIAQENKRMQDKRDAEAKKKQQEADEFLAEIFA